MSERVDTKTWQAFIYDLLHLPNRGPIYATAERARDLPSWKAVEAALDASPKAEVRTERRLQFWRESEQAWVDHVLIRTWGASKDEPKKWRHRVITTTVTASDWEDGK